MTTQAFREALRRLSLTQGEAAAELDLHIRTVSRYYNGHARIPRTVERALALLVTERLHKYHVEDTNPGD